MPHVVRALSFVAKLLFAGVMAYGVAQYRAGASEARSEARFVAVEQKVTTLDSQIVPRREHEAHWASIENSQNQIGAQLRDVQTTQTQILLKLTK